MRRPLLILTLLLLALGAGSLVPAGAEARRTGPCLDNGTGPRCHFWYGRTTAVSDGDTIRVDIAGDGTKRAYTVRFIDTQAMEQSVYSRHPKQRRGECHALEATARLEQLIRASHWRVRLAAQNPRSRAGARLSRSVAVKVRGHWEDVGAKLMAEGHTLWMAGIVETAWNETYNRLGQEAAQRHVGLWNPTHCGAGPSQDVPIRTWVSWDPNGVDTQHVDGEWIKVQNLSATTPLPLGGWWLRDSMLRRFTFPRGTTVAPFDTVTLYAGHGENTPTSFYWGLSEPPFQNAGDSRHLGDGGYLFDPHGDLRAAAVYPCLVACSDPLQGAVEIVAHPRNEEYVLIRNVSPNAIDLYGYEMTEPGYSYFFGPNSFIAPGGLMKLDVPPGQDTPSVRHWGIPHLLFRDRGGAVRLQTYSDITLACDAWGSGSC